MAKVLARPTGIKKALNESGWFPGHEVLAAGEFRQGAAPSMAAMVTGTALLGIFKRGSKSVPRYFILALTDDRVVALKASNHGDEDSDLVAIHEGEQGSFPRSSVKLSAVENKDLAKGAMLTIGDESFEVSRPNVDVGDPDTDELIQLLS